MKGRFSFLILLLSTFILSFIFVISLSFLISLQKDQLNVIRDVLDFDVQIKYSDIDSKLLDLLQKVDSYYLCNDSAVFTNSYTFKKRFCQSDLFSNPRFKGKFDLFPANIDENSFKIASQFSSSKLYNDIFYVDIGKNRRANLYKDNFQNFDFFVSPYINLDGILFENIFVPTNDTSDVLEIDFKNQKHFLNPKIKNLNNLFYGIYATDFNRLVRELKKNNIKFKTFKHESKTIYSALIYERVIFFFVLFFILIILSILICRLFIRSIDKEKRNIASLITIGFNKNIVYRIFCLPSAVLTYVSIIAGSAAGSAFSTTDSIKKMIFAILFDTDKGVGFALSYPLLYVYLLVSGLIVTAMYHIILSRIRKVDVIGIVKDGAGN